MQKHGLRFSGSFYRRLQLIHLIFFSRSWAFFLISSAASLAEKLSSFSHSSSMSASFSDNSQSMPLARSSFRLVRLNLVWRRFHRSMAPLFFLYHKFSIIELFNLSWIDSQILPWSGLPFLNWNNSLAIISRKRRMSRSSVRFHCRLFTGSHLHGRV